MHRPKFNLASVAALFSAILFFPAQSAEPVPPQPEPEPPAASVRLGKKGTNSPSIIALPRPVIKPRPRVLVADADTKSYVAKPGETTAALTFYVTNVTGSAVLISNVTTSCGCTVAQLPAPLPWLLASGASGPINVSVDLRGKVGLIEKSIAINYSNDAKVLLVKVTVPDPALSSTSTNMGDRNRNVQAAQADRQAVFKNDCARCHLEPARGKMGQQLFAAACGICHEAEHRASMVSDLHAPKTARDLQYWLTWASHGKPGTLMPAFAESDGGPLTEAQIDSLADYLFHNFPNKPVAAGRQATAAH
jgi:cytochrome c553